MSTGLFITFEGSEGCGKTTQITHLAARLEKLGRKVIVTREPGGTPIGETIRHLLKFSPAGSAMKPETELLLFAASRAQIVRELILPALQEGATVIADRFLDSTTVYQGIARRLDPAAVKFINDFAVGGCVPDITFVLDLDPKIAHARMMRRPRPVAAPDRMESEPPDFYENVRAGFLKIAEREPQRVRVIDASLPAGEVEAAIWDEVQKLNRKP